MTPSAPSTPASTGSGSATTAGGSSTPSIAPADALPEIADAVGERTLLIVDGGVRRGIDVLKGIALGADLVAIGRPVLWGLAVDGADGVQRVLELLRDELSLAMALTGCRSIDEITPDLLVRPHA